MIPSHECVDINQENSYPCYPLAKVFIGAKEQEQEQENKEKYLNQILKDEVEGKEKEKEKEKVQSADSGDGVSPPEEMDFVGGHEFENTGNEFFGYFKKYGKLKPGEKVLDVGCGIGRMAVPLARYLDEDGSYSGFDIVPMGIEWCSENITPKFPRFSFNLADVYNKLYNPNGKYASSEYRFPYEDEFFDFVFLTSVFTHMLPDELENYLSEISRVLRQGGRTFITYFLLTPDSEKLIGEGKSHQKFLYELEECKIINTEIPEAAIAYDEHRIRSFYTKYGLEIQEPIRYGGWCGRSEFTSYQDIIVASK